MRKMKKLASLLLAMIMVFAMSMTALADNQANTYKLTIKGTTEGHTYEVYQIFTGDISGTAPNYVLSSVKYGQNYVPTGKNVGDRVPDADLEAITEAFAQNVAVTGTAYQTVSSTASNTVIEGLPAGYYLVKETTQNINGHDAYTKHILQVVGNTEVDLKSDVPTVEKKVQEDDKNVIGTTDDRIPDYIVGEDYNDVADYNIGEAVPFKLIGTLPSNYADYTTYQYIFHDTLSAGLAYNGDAKVYVDNGTGTELVDVTNAFTITPDTKQTAGSELTISCNNLKAVTSVTITKDSKIVVMYTATLTNSAVIGLNGNINTVYLQFSNNPNADGSGHTGNTPEDKVIVFTYELDVTKVNGETPTEKLQGAEFRLLNTAQTQVAKVDANGKFVEWVDVEDVEDGDGTVLTSGANGMFIIQGLDDGTYYLEETKAPVGYNLLEKPIKLVITATTVNNQAWGGLPGAALTALTITVGEGEDAKTEAGSPSTGIVNLTVENNKGATLPSTGGMGTTLFYVAGFAMMLTAAGAFVARRRMTF